MALLLYVLLRGLDATALKGLQLAGASHLVNGENPISFCNVFFFSQLVVGLVALLPARQTLPRELAALGAADRCLLALDAGLGLFLGPIAYYLALQSLSVVSQTLLFALVLPLSALLARWLLGEPLPRGFALSLGLIAAGLLLPQVASAAMGGPMDDRVGIGWALVGVAAFSSAAVTGRTIAGRGWPVAVSVGVPSLLTALVFALIALVLFGPHHFLLLQLWWVLGVIGVYAVVLSLGRELCLRLAYRHSSVAMVSLWGSLSLPVAVVSAALLLHEPLSPQAVLGLALVLAGALWSSAPAQSDRPPHRYLP
ncbi:DMT family transporter [Cyanobium sp. Morenito 9A2]|uniref:DMT family transporter n=1 Tax=Cyanobium sp. Morenito 9A2 TaxID=2823718 RepID=UPI0020CBD05D|nr:DMT family transporter [Cyanobium sp. Morenito 9A2]MCP9848903.1 DMT family transporter [Cyanobium sp. Morenito 9A2]